LLELDIESKELENARRRVAELRVGDETALVSYREQGSGPPLVLLHGLGASSSVWHMVMGRLARRWRVLAPDLPGNGQSPAPPPSSTRGSWYGGLVCRFVEQVAGPGTALVGHSMSGGLAMLAALEQPDLFSALVGLAPAGLGSEMPLGLRLGTLPAVGSIMALLVPTAFRLLGATRTEALLRRGFARSGDSEAVMPLLKEAVATYASPVAVRAHYRLLREAASFRGQRVRYQLAHRLHELRLPTLLVWGALDGVLPVTHAHRAAAACPELEVKVLPGCGHAPQVECPELLCTVLGDFLLSHGRAVSAGAPAG
jgi:pimeloyl-ACP methyl ester carboxylesterase